MQNDKTIEVGHWVIKKDRRSSHYHLMKKVERIDNKSQLPKTTLQKIGYNIPIEKVVKLIAEAESFNEANTLIELLQRISLKIDLIKADVLTQLNLQSNGI